MTLSRRRFLAGLAGTASTALLGCAGQGRREITGGFVDGGGGIGSGPSGPEPGGGEGVVRVPVVVVGAGMAGLAAAWWMERSGVDDLVVLEAGAAPGGNARWGRSAGLPHPWGGRHVVLPGPADPELRTLLTDLDLLGEDGWNELARVREPVYRLHRWGRWRRGLEEALFETPRERDAWSELRERVARAGTGGDLDRRPADAWLDVRGRPAPPTVRWLVDHLCRDRYGVSASGVSARAAVAALAEHGAGPGLSWPEGTGGLARRLADGLGPRLVTGAPVLHVGRAGTGVRVRTPETVYRCEAVVWAAPASSAAGVVEGAPKLDVRHAAWVVANLTLDGEPAAKGAPRAWHNVRPGSRSTGYVPADHQTLRTARERTVWTWYLPLGGEESGPGGSALFRRSWTEWVELVLADLEPAHPDIRRHVTRVDVRRLRRGTAVPEPGTATDPVRRRMREAGGPVLFAHGELGDRDRVADAVAEGVRAGRRVVERLARV